LLRNGTLDHSRSARAIEAVFNNATRQAHLIEELLDVSRIVAGRAPLDPERLDIGDNIRGAVEAILPLAEAKGVDVHVDARHGVMVIADPRRLEQVFLNVLSNAVKFTPEGGRISVGSTVNSGRVDVTITDTGAGIDAAFLPHVFERFRQADSTMARSVGGLGLGLFIARHLVDAQGGRIVARSDGRNLGATFVVSFPIVARAPIAGNPEPRTTDAAGPTLAGVRVLLVDDEADAREVMTSALETCGAAVAAAASTSEALRLLAENCYDVLLSDLAMPGADGYALIGAVRQTSSPYADIPAAAVTASAGDEARLRAIAAGFQVHLAKPVQPQVLAATVAHLAGLRTRAGIGSPAPQAG
jgi:CheY-like chemotaxis protein